MKKKGYLDTVRQLKYRLGHLIAKSKGRVISTLPLLFISFGNHQLLNHLAVVEVGGVFSLDLI